MELFVEDVFSKSEMEWVRIDDSDKISIEIKLLLQKNYKNISNSLVSIKKSGSLNINSSNFLIETNNNFFVIKRIYNSEKSKVKYLCEVDTKISKFFNKIPKIIIGDDETQFSEYKKYYYIIYEKVGITHYSGKKEEFEEFLYTFIELDKLIKKNQIRVSNNHHNINNESLLRLKNFYATPDDINENNPLNILKLHKEHILNKINEIKFDFNIEKNLSPYHIDIHPHNISIVNNNLFFLDQDSIQMTTLERSLGFALYKLLRQSYYFYKKNKEVSLFIHSKVLGAFADEENIDLKSLKNGAATEILRRLLIIYDQVALEKYSKWEFMFSSHIRGLYEIDEIFN